MTLAATFSFLTPRGGVLVVLALVPLAALFAALRRVEHARRVLRLPPPPRSRTRVRAGLLVLVAALLAVAAAQPAVRTQTAVRARTDAQAFVVIDTSRSMLAAPSPRGESRLARAKQAAVALGASLPGIPLGVATFTDRVLPDLFPTSDRAAYDSVVAALQVDGPPPEHVNTVATTLDAISQVATQGFFAPTVKRRALVLVTDGESRAFDPGSVAGELRGHGIHLAIIRVGSGADRVWKPNGTPEANFRPDPQGARLDLAELADAAHVPRNAGAAVVVSRALGRGPTAVVGIGPHTRTLAPAPAALALLVVLWLLGGRSARERLRDVTFTFSRGRSRRAT